MNTQLPQYQNIYHINMNNKTSETSHEEEEQDILFGVINRFIGYFTQDSQKESINDANIEYPFVPMDTRQVYAQLKCARDHLRRTVDMDDISFIDIGCGIGNILLFAEMMDFKVIGIEKDDFPYKVAAKLFDSDSVSQVDIWQYHDFSNFDVIYYFRPFHDGDMQRRFEELIENQLKTGGILIANRKMSEKIDSDPRFSRLDPKMPVWEKATV